MRDTKSSQADINPNAYTKLKSHFLPDSIRPVKSVPDLLAENRDVAKELASTVMAQMVAIAVYFGVPLLDLVMEALPEEAPSIETDGVREHAAAKTYFDLAGSVPLADICRGTYASRVPTLRCVAQELRRRDKAHYAANNPLLRRIFDGADELEDVEEGDNPPEEPSEDEDSKGGEDNE